MEKIRSNLLLILTVSTFLSSLPATSGQITNEYEDRRAFKRGQNLLEVILAEIRNTRADEMKLLQGIYSSLSRPRDCTDVLSSRNTLYTVYPGDQRSIDVFCDTKTPGGPWLVFQRRKDGSVDFFRNWKNYTEGFGDLNGEFWLGNENLYLLTSTGRYKLRVDLEDFQGQKSYAEYSSFSISSSDDYYRLNYSGYSGNAGDSLDVHNRQRFSTKDADNDFDSSQDCANMRRGAWWYKDCTNSNLNGLYLRGNFTTPFAGGIVWYKWRGNSYSLKTTEMKISRID